MSYDYDRRMASAKLSVPQDVRDLAAQGVAAAQASEANMEKASALVGSVAQHLRILGAHAKREGNKAAFVFYDSLAKDTHDYQSLMLKAQGDFRRSRFIENAEVAAFELKHEATEEDMAFDVSVYPGLKPQLRLVK